MTINIKQCEIRVYINMLMFKVKGQVKTRFDYYLVSNMDKY